MAAASVALYGVVGITYFGAFSRFTHGRYTPGFHAYQVDRAPDDESTRMIPVMDVILASMLVIPRTRFAAAAIGVTLQLGGIGMRIKAGKNLATDILLVATTAFVGYNAM